MDNGNAVTLKYMGINFKRCYFFIISLLFGCIASYVFAENERKLLGEKLQEFNVFSKKEDLSFIYFGDVGCGYCRKYLKDIQPRSRGQSDLILHSTTWVSIITATRNIRTSIKNIAWKY